MLKRIALTALFAAATAFVGVGVAKAQPGAKKSMQGEKAPPPNKTPEIIPPSPKGFCFPPRAYC